MSRFRSLKFLSVFLLGVVLLTADSQYSDFTPAPDYDSDYNATFEYSFYSNASSDDLERFREHFTDQEEEEDTGGQQEQEEETVTTATTRGTTERGGNDGFNAASLPVCLDIRTLVWTLMILMILNSQQL
ncbi:uncharacterized protein [Brachyistius frenatus]|uniref:uncharacterized protein n=1 Tax=Brachyistius frenatus TaxID=100188 RepID=UPI0037E83944